MAAFVAPLMTDKKMTHHSKTMANDRASRPLSEAEVSRREEQRRRELLSRDDIPREYKEPSRRWLELAALRGDGPPMIRLSRRMVRYQRGSFEDWLAARTVNSTSENVGAP